jgi:hypothetical protein
MVLELLFIFLKGCEKKMPQRLNVVSKPKIITIWPLPAGELGLMVLTSPPS